MLKITIYQKPTCTTCRQVYNALKESGVDFEAVDYQLCRYITRPAIANERLKRNRAGQVVLQLKSPYKLRCHYEGAITVPLRCQALLI
jgi:glutaredoxin